MNHYLNVFRFFHESTEKESIENNLSRAFAVCLNNNSFFLSEYIKGVVTPEDYKYLFSSVGSDARWLAARAALLGRQVASFDRDFDKFKDIRRFDPSA